MVFNKIITTITNVLKKNAHDQNEQTIIFASGVNCLPHFCPEIKRVAHKNLHVSI